MAEQNQQPKKKKGAKKVSFEVKMPLTSSKIHVYGYSVEELAGGIVCLDLTRSLKGRSFELKTRLKIEDGELAGDAISLILAGSYVRRMMRKGTDYVEDSFETNCRDKAIRIKPFLITRNKVSRAVRRELRNQAKKIVEAYVKALTADEIFSDIIANKLQKTLSLRLKKVYPLALCEIRHFEVVGEIDKKKQAKEDKVKEEEKNRKEAEEKEED